MSNQHQENWPLSVPAPAPAPALAVDASSPSPSFSAPAAAPPSPRPYRGIVHDEEYVSNFVFPPVAAAATTTTAAAATSAATSIRLLSHGDNDDDNEPVPGALPPLLPWVSAGFGSVGTLPPPATASSTGRYPTPVSHTISIRRGPQVRHLPVAIPSPPVRAAALARAKSKVRAVFLALVLLTLVGGLSLAAAMTFVASQAAMLGQVSGSGLGWLVTSLVVSASGAAILYLTRHQKPVLLDDEWIELAALRGRDRDPALSPQPPSAPVAAVTVTGTGTSLELPPPDSAEAAAAAGGGPSSVPAPLDPDIRIYVEDLEFQLKQLEDRLAAVSGREPTGPPNPRPTALATISPPSPSPAMPSKKGKEPAVNQFNSLTSRSSSRRLLAADTLGSPPAVPPSATEGSILTQLCAAVTEPYSPLMRHEEGESSRQPEIGQHGTGRHGNVSSIDIACGYMEEYRK